MKKIWLCMGLCFMAALGFQNLLGINAYSLLSEKRWEIESMRLANYEIIVPHEVEDAYLIFREDGVFGIPGCNNYSAKYQIKANGKHIFIQPGASTKRMCNTINMRIEEIFLKHFIGGFVVQGDDEGIDLIGENFSVRLVPSLIFEP